MMETIKFKNILIILQHVTCFFFVVNVIEIIRILSFGWWMTPQKSQLINL